MGDYINTKVELFYGDRYFKEHVIAPDFDWRRHKKEFSKYFADRGFFVSRMYEEYFSIFTGVRSDRYISMDLFYFYILPCLNKFNFKNAYTDKNMFSVLFDGFNQPKTVVKCMNGLWYDGKGQSITEEKGVDLIRQNDSRMIIKPTIETNNGIGVSLVDRNNLEANIAFYDGNFIVQFAVQQHEVMATLNESSLNTMRVFTYRDVRKQIHVLDDMTFLRVGGKGSVMDNGSAGGWLAGVRGPDGKAASSCCRFKHAEPVSLEECLGMKEFSIPEFKKVYPFVEKLHGRMPYFDLIGWDIAIDSEGEPVVIEMNVEPSVEGPQLTCGPMFGKYLDEVMERVSTVQKSRIEVETNSFRPGFDRMFQTAGNPFNLHQ